MDTIEKEDVCVLITDVEINSAFIQVAEWAKRYCKGFVQYNVVDVSDFSYMYDEIGEYWFNNAADANWFILKWKNR